MSLDRSEDSGLYEDTSASMMDSDAVNSLNSTARKTGPKSSCAPKFCSWSFRLTIKADFASAVDKGKRLQEHISGRTLLGRPQSVTSQIAFYDATLLSGVPDSDGLVSIALQGYVQTRSGTRVSTMQAWIESAVWTPVPGGLASDADFKHNMQRSEDANDSWTQFVTFGSVGMNNHGRATQRNARKVGCHKSILIFCFSKSHVFVPPCLHHFVRSSS